MSTPNTNYTFRNWYGSLECRPAYYYQPRNEEEVAAIVRDAGASGRTVRAVGAGHSWSPLVLTNDILINLDELGNLVQIDKEQQQVTIQAGMHIASLNEIIDQHGLAMANLGSTSEQSIAGALATGTHGTGLEQPILAQQMVAADLVTSDGQVLRISADTQPDMMAALRVHLGALGILTQVTIQCVPAFNLHLHAEVLPFEQVLDDMQRLISSNDRVRLYWFAHTEKIYVMTMNRTHEPALVGNKIISWIHNTALQRYVLGALLSLEYDFRSPHLVDTINRIAARLGFDEKDQVERSDLLLNVPIPPKHNECEYAIPVARAAEALRQTRDLIMKQKLNANMPVEVRFAKKDNSLLSPAYDRTTCFIGAYAAGASFEQAYFDAFEQLMKDFEGRPHWGKHFTVTARELEKMYPQYDLFNTIRKQLDPTGMFANTLIRDLFGDHVGAETL